MTAPRVTLTKRTNIFGQQPVGAAFDFKGQPGVTEDALRLRAFRLLQRWMPDENPMEWIVATDEIHLDTDAESQEPPTGIVEEIAPSGLFLVSSEGKTC